MKIICTEEEKKAIIEMIRESTVCPFKKRDCIDQESCNRCMEEEIQWNVTNIQGEITNDALEQPKTGHWIPWQPDSDGWSETFTCSYCRHNTKDPYPTKIPDEYLFCPYCGAKMEESTET